jgi:hypothetical protein
MGPIGPIGPTGATGAAGEIGPAGKAGANGATGPKGDVGPKGDTGAAGDPGPAGAPGTTGATGPSGVTGQNGQTFVGSAVTLGVVPVGGTSTVILNAAYTVLSPNSFVLLTTDGEFTHTTLPVPVPPLPPAPAPSELIVDIDFVVDGARVAYRRVFLPLSVKGFGTGAVRGQWSLSTLLPAPFPGLHTATVFASVPATAPAGATAVVCQAAAGPGCRLNIVILNK